MKCLTWFVASVLMVLLSACGGGGGSAGTVIGAPPSSNTSTLTVTVARPSVIELLSTSASLASSGEGAISITAIVKDANNAGMVGQTVTFSADSGLLVVDALGVTNASGIAIAALNVGSDKTLRDILVSATAKSVSGTATASLTIPVVGTKVTVNGDLNLQSGVVTQYSVKLVDSAGAAISGARVRLTSQLGNPISNAGVGTTDFNGVFGFTYTANTGGQDVLTATGLGASSVIRPAISTTDLAILSPATDTTIPVGTSQTITLRYRVGGIGQSSQNVVFSTTRGNLSAGSAVTDANGVATVIISSSSAGAASVVATIAGVGQVNLPLQFIATNPTAIALQANPGAVPPNSSGGTANQAALEAIVRDPSGNAVANRQVNFNLVRDTSGGRLSQPSAVTDGNGRASVQFIPGANSTASNGVVVQASVQGSTNVSSTTSLTVNGESLFISIAFGNTIGNENENTYRKPFSVYVTDANGAAVSNKNLSLRVIPTFYGKGFFSFVAGTPATSTTLAVQSGWAQFSTSPACPNEDLNLNGQIDPGEDINNNGSLQPGSPAFTRPGTVRTDASGLANFDLIYGEQYAYWLAVRIEARATVGGTESVSSIPFTLSALASELTTENVTPAFVRSPYGTGSSCADPN